jgi:hypothetical protein
MSEPPRRLWTPLGAAAPEARREADDGGGRSDRRPGIGVKVGEINEFLARQTPRLRVRTTTMDSYPGLGGALSVSGIGQGSHRYGSLIDQVSDLRGVTGAGKVIDARAAVRGASFRHTIERCLRSGGGRAPPFQSEQRIQAVSRPAPGIGGGALEARWIVEVLIIEHDEQRVRAVRPRPRDPGTLARDPAITRSRRPGKRGPQAITARHVLRLTTS